MDKLDAIFDMQSALNKEIVALRHLENITPDEWQQKLTLAMLSELTEALDGTNWKWWKNKTPQRSRLSQGRNRGYAALSGQHVPARRHERRRNV